MLTTNFYYKALDANNKAIKEQLPDVVWKNITSGSTTGDTPSATNDYVAAAYNYAEGAIESNTAQISSAYEERIQAVLAGLNSLTTNTFSQAVGQSEFELEV